MSGSEPILDNNALRLAVRMYLHEGEAGRAWALERHGELADWDVSRLEDFSNAFRVLPGARPADLSGEDLSGWDVSAAVRMHSMFQGARLAGSAGWLRAWAGRLGRLRGACEMFADCADFDGAGTGAWRVRLCRPCAARDWARGCALVEEPDWRPAAAREPSS